MDECFYGFFGIFVGFNTRQPLVTYQGFGVFGQKQFHCFFDLLKQMLRLLILV
jgi:hypothetical protein